MVMPMPSVVQYRQHSYKRPPKTAIRAAIARLSSPPADHNISGLPSLSPEENVCVEQARAALARMKQTFACWIAVACALKALEDKAHRMGGRTFARLCEREGLGSDVLNRGRRWRLHQILERLPAVEAWRAQLTDRQRFKWASPESVLRYCPLFVKPKPARAAGSTNVSPRIEPTDTAEDIATALVALFLPRKSEAIAQAMLAKLKEGVSVQTPPLPPRLPQERRQEAPPEAAWCVFRAGPLTT
jgi:hypothetical protein